MPTTDTGKKKTPPRLTKQQNAYLDARNRGMSVAMACRKAGINSRQTVVNWRNKNPLFKEKEEEAAAATTDFVEDKLMQLIAQENPTAIIFYLKTRAKGRGWSERPDITEKGEYIQPNININVVTKPTPKEENGDGARKAD